MSERKSFTVDQNFHQENVFFKEVKESQEIPVALDDLHVGIPGAHPGHGVRP